MNLPDEHRDVFHKLAFGQLMITFDELHGMEAVNKIKDYVTDLIAWRRRHPSEDDFITELATTEVDGAALDPEVVISFFRQLMNAGGETSYNGFSNLMVGLLTHPEQWQMLLDDRSLVPAAVEEGLRWEPPVCQALRTPTQEVEIGGVTMQPGDLIGFSISAINRDPRCRCAHVSEPLSAELARSHNDANVLALGARLVGPDMAKACVSAFLSSDFLGGRHQRRVDQLSQLLQDSD